VLLDEPTIGLDFTAQAAIRSFVARYATEHAATVLLTSHYLTDIEALAARVVVMAHGHLVHSGSLNELRRLDSGDKLLLINGHLEATGTAWDEFITERKPGELRLQVPAEQAPAALAALSALDGITDLSLSDPPLEDALSQLYAGASQ
jgi:ABC-2 type transport system ATP-binding protein